MAPVVSRRLLHISVRCRAHVRPMSLLPMLSFHLNNQHAGLSLANFFLHLKLDYLFVCNVFKCRCDLNSVYLLMFDWLAIFL